MKTVLLVDDDAVVLAVYQKRLERDGFSVKVAHDGLAAMKTLAEHAPDLVVLDLMMPNINGVDVLKFMRADPRLKNIPVIVFSNAYMTELAQEAMAAGADKGLLKAGCTPSLLSQCVKDLLAGTPGVANTSQLLAVPSAKPPVTAALHPTEPTPPAQATPMQAGSVDQTVLENVHAEFIKSAPTELAEIQNNCIGYLEAHSSPGALVKLKNLYQRLHFVGARAGLAGFDRLAALATAFEALVFDLVVNPTQANASTLHTIARALQCLSALFEQLSSGQEPHQRKARVIVIDDDQVSNRLIVAALTRANLDAESVTTPQAAFQLLQTNRYDLILLDVVMPGMSGYELCERVRQIPAYTDTPVIFITAHDDFPNCIQSVLSGGNDIIGKPVFPLELALKATTELLLHQMCRGSTGHRGRSTLEGD